MVTARDKRLALAMRAGARAILKNKRLDGTTYVFDVFGEYGEPKEISYYEAAQMLYEYGQKALLEGGPENEDKAD